MMMIMIKKNNAEEKIGFWNRKTVSSPEHYNDSVPSAKR